MNYFVLCLAFVSLGSCHQVLDKTDVDTRPNMLLIVVDDLGFADLGMFGSEIETPHLDQLAQDGVLFTNFHASPACSPTRAMLLSGTDSHIAGLGTMAGDAAPNQEGQPGYEGYLNNQVVALPALLREAGYATYMTGKWHLGATKTTSPSARGFDKSFTLLPGGAGAFSNRLPLVGPNLAGYREDDHLVDSLPDDFYATRFYTERMIDYIEEGRSSQQPFFAFLSHTAPHWPLQAPRASIQKYTGVYDEGYDALRSQRLQRLQELGLAPDTVKVYPRLNGEKAWETLTLDEQRYEARLMEIYAAMVDDIDVYTGKLIDYLKSAGLYDNTLIFFMSDNGPEGHNLDRGWESLAQWASTCCDNSYENIGNADSYVWYGPNWAQAGNVPLRTYKAFTSQGGILVPAFAHFPKHFQQNIRSEALLTVKDIMPTFLEWANVDHPDTFRGRTVAPLQGRSLTPLLTGEQSTIHKPDDYMAWELFGKCALRQGDWKIINLPSHEAWEGVFPNVKTDQWQLYNLKDDPAELHDLAAMHPEKLEAMLSLWEEYVAQNNVIVASEGWGY